MTFSTGRDCCTFLCSGSFCCFLLSSKVLSFSCVSISSQILSKALAETETCTCGNLSLLISRASAGLFKTESRSEWIDFRCSSCLLISAVRKDFKSVSEASRPFSEFQLQTLLSIKPTHLPWT